MRFYRCQLNYGFQQMLDPTRSSIDKMASNDNLSSDIVDLIYVFMGFNLEKLLFAVATDSVRGILNDSHLLG